MIVLIVEPDPDLGRLWKRHMERQGAEVHLAFRPDHTRLYRDGWITTEKEGSAAQ